MEQEKPIYTEKFVKSSVSNDPHSIDYVLSQIREVHSEEYGWVVSEPTIIPNPDGRTVTLSVFLEKYKKTVGKSR